MTPSPAPDERPEPDEQRAPEDRLWTRNFVLAFATMAFVSLVFYVLLTSMAIYAVDAFGASDSAAGLASSAFIIGSIVARFFSGRLVEVIAPRKVLLVSIVAFAALAFLYVPAGELWLVIVVRALHGVAFGISNTALVAGVQSLIPPARRAEGTGYFGLSSTLSTALGPFMATLLVTQGRYDELFMACSVASVLAVLAVLAMKPGRRETTRGPITPSGPRGLAAFVEAKVVPVSCVMLLAGVAYSGVAAFLTSYMVAEGLASAASLYFLSYAASITVSRLVMGRLQDRRGDNIVMFPALVSLALAHMLLVVEPSNLVVSLAGVLAGFGFGTAMSAVQAIAVQAVRPARMGTALSTFYLVLDIGVGFGPVLLGLVVPLAGYSGMYAVTASLTVVAIGLYAKVHAANGREPRVA